MFMDHEKDYHLKHSRILDKDVYFLVVQKSKEQIVDVMAKCGEDRIEFRNAMFDEIFIFIKGCVVVKAYKEDVEAMARRFERKSSDQVAWPGGELTLQCPLTGEKDMRKGYFVLQSLTRAYGARTSGELPPLQGKGVPVGLAKRVMPRIVSPKGYHQLLQLLREEGVSSMFGSVMESSSVPSNLLAEAKAFVRASEASSATSGSSSVGAAAAATVSSLKWANHTLSPVPFPTQAAVLNTLPSFYETYTKIQPVEAEYLRVITSNTPGTAAATGTVAEVAAPRFPDLLKEAITASRKQKQNKSSGDAGAIGGSEEEKEIEEQTQYWQKGNEYFKKKEFAEAVAYYTKAISLVTIDLEQDASDFSSGNSSSKAQNRADALEQAKSFHTSARVASSPLNTSAHVLLSNRSAAQLAVAEAAKIGGRAKQLLLCQLALEDARNAVKLNARYAKGHFREGSALVQLTQLASAEAAVEYKEGAVQSLLRALKLKPGDRNALKMLADLGVAGDDVSVMKAMFSATAPPAPQQQKHEQEGAGEEVKIEAGISDRNAQDDTEDKESEEQEENNAEEEEEEEEEKENDENRSNNQQNPMHSFSLPPVPPLDINIPDSLRRAVEEEQRARGE